MAQVGTEGNVRAHRRCAAAAAAAAAAAIAASGSRAVGAEGMRPNEQERGAALSASSRSSQPRCVSSPGLGAALSACSRSSQPHCVSSPGLGAALSTSSKSSQPRCVSSPGLGAALSASSKSSQPRCVSSLGLGASPLRAALLLLLVAAARAPGVCRVARGSRPCAARGGRTPAAAKQTPAAAKQTPAAAKQTPAVEPVMEVEEAPPPEPSLSAGGRISFDVTVLGCNHDKLLS